MTTILTAPKDLKPGNEFHLTKTTLARVVGVDATGVTVRVVIDADGYAMPSAMFMEDLADLFKQGVPVIFEPNVIEGTVTIPPHGEPASMTIGQQTSLLMDMVRQEGKARVGDTYKVRWEQLPGSEEVSK